LRTLQAAQLARTESTTPEEERLASAATGGPSLEPQTRPAPGEGFDPATAAQPGPSTRPAPVETPTTRPAPAEGNAGTTPTPVDPATDPTGEAGEGEAEEVFDLVGTWRADLPAGGEVELRITEESGFVWTFHPEQGDPKSIEGQRNTDGNLMLLESPQEGTMAGVADVLGANSFRFHLEGAAADDPGLTFRKPGDRAADDADGPPQTPSPRGAPEGDKPAEDKPAGDKPAGESEPAKGEESGKPAANPDEKPGQ